MTKPSSPRRGAPAAKTPWRLLACLGLALLAQTPGAAWAMPFLFEVRELTSDNPPFSRNVYACPLCTPELFEPVVQPPGFEKAPGKLFLPSLASAELPEPPPGVAPGLDLVPEIPGDDFQFVAQLLTAEVLAPDPTFGFLVRARVQRDTEFTYSAGQVVHQVRDAEGSPYVLFSFDLELAETLDVTQLGALASLPLPAGWSYSSRVLAEDLVFGSGGLATVFAQGQRASWQLVPEPATALLLGAGLLGLRARAQGAARPRGGSAASRG